MSCTWPLGCGACIEREHQGPKRGHCQCCATMRVTTRHCNVGHSLLYIKKDPSHIIQLSPALLAIALGLDLPLAATEPGPLVSTHLSKDIVAINVPIELEGLQAVGSFNLTVINTTASSFEWGGLLPSTSVSSSAQCQSGSPSYDHNETSRLHAAATQGLFPNITVFPSGTASLRMPTNIGLR